MNADLSNLLKDKEAVLVSSPANIKYITDYSGFSMTERECFLLITHNNKYLITDKRYSEAIKKLVPGFEIIDTGATEFISRKNDLLTHISQLGIEENDITVKEYKLLKKQIRPLANIDLSSFREIKTAKEIKKIEKACALADQVFEFALTKLKIGISEKEIASEIIWFLKSKGAEASFPPIVAFGKNSAIPHHLSGDTKLTKQTIVLLDLGAMVNGYCSDLSRTVYFGKAPQRFIEIHAAVLESQERAIAGIRAGVKASTIDKIARNYIISKDYPNIGHSVGHGVGVEVHESPHLSPYSEDELRDNMVFSVEPGIYFPDYGGIRIEDIVLIRNNKAQLISHANRNIIEV